MAVPLHPPQRMSSCPPCLRGDHLECDTSNQRLSAWYCACWAGGHDATAPLLQLQIAGTPQPQGSKIANRFGGGVREANKKLAPWRSAAIAAIATEMGNAQPLTVPVSIAAEFYFARPRSHYGTGRNQETVKLSSPLRHGQKPDLDKLLRALGDALTQGGALRDDSQIVRWATGKNWTLGAPHTWVVLTLAD